MVALAVIRRPAVVVTVARTGGQCTAAGEHRADNKSPHQGGRCSPVHAVSRLPTIGANTIFPRVLQM